MNAAEKLENLKINLNLQITELMSVMSRQLPPLAKEKMLLNTRQYINASIDEVIISLKGQHEEIETKNIDKDKPTPVKITVKGNRK